VDEYFSQKQMGSIKRNTDGSAFGKPGNMRAGLGGVLRNHEVFFAPSRSLLA